MRKICCDGMELIFNKLCREMHLQLCQNNDSKKHLHLFRSLAEILLLYSLFPASLERCSILFLFIFLDLIRFVFSFSNYFLISQKIFLCFPNVPCLTIDASRCPQVVVAGWTGRAGRQDPHLCSDPGQGRHTSQVPRPCTALSRVTGHLNIAALIT